MRGEITDFKDSLRRRVAMLEGVPVTALHEVLTQRLRLNPGARELVQACKAAGMQVLLVSGGFTFFADRVREMLAIDHVKSNVLEVVEGRLTGRLVDQAWGDICDGEEKKRTVLALCAQLNIRPAQAIAVGDGANDLPMMKACSEVGGISVAYHAKPKVREQAMVSIETGGHQAATVQAADLIVLSPGVPEAVLEIAQPRAPCSKFQLYSGRADASALMTLSGRCGWYYRVVTPGRAPVTSA